MKYEKFEIKVEKKKKRRFRKNHLFLMLAAVLSLICIAAGYTYSQLNTTTDPVENEFQFGQTEITVVENRDWNWDSKQVRLTASSGADFVPGVARAMIVPYVQDAEENYISCDLGALSEPVGNVMGLGDFKLEFADDWSSNWFYKDGYFYYKKVLKPGETTTMLLKKVSLNSDSAKLQKKYKDANIKVEVMANILQAEGGGPETEWGITVTDNTVSVSVP